MCLEILFNFSNFLPEKVFMSAETIIYLGASASTNITIIKQSLACTSIMEIHEIQEEKENLNISLSTNLYENRQRLVFSLFVCVCLTGRRQVVGVSSLSSTSEIRTPPTLLALSSAVMTAKLHQPSPLLCYPYGVRQLSICVRSDQTFLQN